MRSSPQDRSYLDAEADAFYARNLRGADPAVLRPAKRVLAGHIAAAGVRPRRVFEVGCSHGDLLYHYVRRGGALEAAGVEPSAEAVRRGREAFGDAVRLEQGTLADNPVSRDPASRGRFDLVVVEDVLCWVSRETLFQSVANLDDALAEEGFLYLREFLPRTSRRNRNHHVGTGEVWCYKPAGPHYRMFTASGVYTVVWQRVWTDEGDPWVRERGADPSEARWMDVLLRKSVRRGFDEGGAP